MLNYKIWLHRKFKSKKYEKQKNNSKIKRTTVRGLDDGSWTEQTILFANLKHADAHSDEEIVYGVSFYLPFN